MENIPKNINPEENNNREAKKIESPSSNLNEISQTTPVDEQTHKYVDHYLKILLWPALIAGIFKISALYNTNQLELIILANGALIILVLVQTTRHHDVNWQTASVIGGLAGAVSSFVVALYKVIFTFKVVYIFNLFTETAIMGVLIAIITGFLYIIIQPIINKYTKERR